MNKIFKLSLFSLLGLLVVSCDEFVEEVEVVDPVAEERGESFSPQEFVTGVYGMHTTFDYAFAYLGITEIISDNANKGSAPTDTGADKNLLDDLTYTSSSPSIRDMWTQWYKTIGRASQSIQFTEEFENIDSGLQARLIGEAKFLRALNYFWLVRSFGDIPIQSIDLVERVPVAEVYEYIIEDLESAISSLPLKSDYAQRDLGRATKGAAQGLLAKVYLYQENWQAAADMANTVISSGQYSLEPDYGVIWTVAGENGVESVFEIQARGEVVAHGVQQYSQTQGARGPGGWGWGFNTPSEDLENAYNEAGDSIRRDATIIFPGETLFDGREVDPGIENPRYNQKAYSSAFTEQADSDKNIRILRYAEILLIHAEALNELGQSGEALASLNQVRNRVNLPDVTTTDQSQLSDIIFLERRLELAMEHDRWFDLIRTNRAAEVMTALGLPFEQRNMLFPIPNEQIIQTPEMVQNPGW